MTRSLNQKEVENFSRYSQDWWNEDGPFKPLHALNPVRLSYLKSQICQYYDRDVEDFKALSGLSVLDIGCGGGLVSEPLCRMGAAVTGIDADQQAIEVARNHAKEGHLDIEYDSILTTDLIAQNKTFDVVLALEIIEHVEDISFFIEECFSLCKPNGLVIFSTLNKTAKSFALGIVAAEYILNWVPKGTHQWSKFIRPSSLARQIRGNNGNVLDQSGLMYHPVKREFMISKTDCDVNYFITASKLK